MVESSGSEKIFRGYMKEPDFELTHFMDPSYPEISPHVHEFCEILYFEGGHVDYVVGSSIFHLKKGDLLIIPPNIFHNPIFNDFETPYERYVLWCDMKVLKELALIDPNLLFFLNSDQPVTHLFRPDSYLRQTLCYRFMVLEDKFQSRATLWRADVKAFLIQLLAEYNAFLLDACGSDEKHWPGLIKSRLSHILNYIADHLDGPLSLDRLAKAFYMDKYNLSHMFKRYLGITVHQYIQKQRVILAKKMLLEGHPATSVYHKCGFSDYSGFYRAFRKEYGLSPSSLRQLTRD